MMPAAIGFVQPEENSAVTGSTGADPVEELAHELDELIQQEKSLDQLAEQNIPDSSVRSDRKAIYPLALQRLFLFKPK